MWNGPAWVGAEKKHVGHWLLNFRILEDRVARGQELEAGEGGVSVPGEHLQVECKAVELAHHLSAY